MINYLDELRKTFRFDELADELNEWSQQVNEDFKDFQEEATFEAIAEDIEKTFRELKEKFENFNEEVADWDLENQEVYFFSQIRHY